MSILRRTLYLLYYLKESDFRQLKTYVSYSASVSGIFPLKIVADAIYSVYKYNISLKDYFCFRFFEQDDENRKQWAGSGYMYEYQLKMNPKGSREILENKIEFLSFFNQFIRRKFCTLSDIREKAESAESVLMNSSGLIVLKGSRGQAGAEVEIINTKGLNIADLKKYMSEKGYDLAEEYVIQHPELMSLSSSGLNTIRIITQLISDKVEILGARLRITVNSKVDNMAAGNIAAPVDIKSGIVCGPGVYSDITKEKAEKHPVTGINIAGFRIPQWDKVISLAERAALHAKANRSIGWDIAVTADHVELIEGNHNWCKLLWQLPVHQGLKSKIEIYS
jgi:hypothetical protein